MNTTADTSPRYVIGASDGFNLLIPRRATHVPESVQQASENAEAAYDAANQAAREVRAAMREAKAAPKIDEANDRAATSAGKALPTDRLAPAAQEALENAQRRLQAAQGARRDAMVVLARTIRSEREEWLPEAREAVEQTRARAIELLRNLAETIDQLESDKLVVVGLASWPDQGSLVGSEIGFGHAQERTEERAEQLRSEAAEQVRSGDRIGGTGHTFVTRQPDHLLGALKVLVEK